MTPGLQAQLLRVELGIVKLVIDLALENGLGQKVFLYSCKAGQNRLSYADLPYS